MILPDCKPSTVYFPLSILKDWKNAFFEDEKLMSKSEAYKDFTLPYSAPCPAFPLLPCSVDISVTYREKKKKVETAV